MFERLKKLLGFGSTSTPRQNEVGYRQFMKDNTPHEFMKDTTSPSNEIVLDSVPVRDLDPNKYLDNLLQKKKESSPPPSSAMQTIGSRKKSARNPIAKYPTSSKKSIPI